MPSLSLTAGLRREYEELFASCQVRPDRRGDVDGLVDALLANRPHYLQVSNEVGTPWHVTAVIHNMESSLDFSRHLHNGDPLTGRTVNVPEGRPRAGSPPFTWEESAADALRFDAVSRWTDWSLSGTLFRIERYNGWGYRINHPEVLSPYLWGFSNHYESGKYIADGRWSDTAVSGQCGAAVLLRRLVERGEIVFDQASVKPMLVYSSDGVLPRADSLQAFLNTFPGINLRVDGWPGARTSDAFKTVTGYYLQGDPRAAG
jgi:lysozyme family protein